MTQRVLVTGGSGFLGRYVVAELVERGYFVRVADNLSAPHSKPIDNALVDFVNLDLRDRASSLRAMKDVDICIASAARVGGIGLFNKQPAAMLDDNVRILSATFEAARTQRVRKLLYVSSSCVFDNSSAYPTTEASLRDSPPPSAGYPASKLVGEFYCKAFQAQYGLPHIIVRPFNVYGPGEVPGEKPGDSHVIPDLTAKLLAGQDPLEIFGDGHQTRCFTHVRDVAHGIVLAAESSAATNEDFNLGYSEEVSVLELAKKLWKLCGRSRAFAFRSLEPFQNDVRTRALDTTKAKTILGWQPRVGLDAGLADFVKWFKTTCEVTRA